MATEYLITTMRVKNVDFSSSRRFFAESPVPILTRKFSQTTVVHFSKRSFAKSPLRFTQTKTFRLFSIALLRFEDNAYILPVFSRVGKQTSPKSALSSGKTTLPSVDMDSTHSRINYSTLSRQKNPLRRNPSRGKFYCCLKGVCMRLSNNNI